MKTPLRLSVLLCAVALSAAAFAASMPTLDVMVADASGKVAYKGKTTAAGSFSTSSLPAGDYVVQLTSRSPVNEKFALVIAAGKQKVVSGAVAGSQFTKGGVAMRIKVAKSANITGQLSDGSAASELTSKVKVVNGKRFVWQGPETGSNIGGRWVEEGTVSSVIRGGKDSLNSSQNRGAGIGR